MKRILVVLIIAISAALCCSCDNSKDNRITQISTEKGFGDENVTEVSDKSNLGEYNIVIESCRLAKDYSGEPIVIVKYVFTNYSEDETSFMFAVSDKVFQNDVSLNTCYFADDSANYTSENKSKEIRNGATISVEVAYELNDSSSDIIVEVSELFSVSNRKVTKRFSIK